MMKNITECKKCDTLYNLNTVDECPVCKNGGYDKDDESDIIVYSKIAEKLNISRTNASQIVERVIKKLKEEDNENIKGYYND